MITVDCAIPAAVFFQSPASWAVCAQPVAAKPSHPTRRNVFMRDRGKAPDDDKWEVGGLEGFSYLVLSHEGGSESLKLLSITND